MNQKQQFQLNKTVRERDDNIGQQQCYLYSCIDSQYNGTAIKAVFPALYNAVRNTTVMGKRFNLKFITIIKLF